ncbi:MAG: RsmD family RNA methyltransferase, partial [Polyangiales bacterium]
VCVESARPALAVIAENRAELGLDDRLEIVARKVSEALKTERRFDLVFADPPWADVPELARDLAKLPAVLAEDALVCVEHASRDRAPELPGLAIDETRTWGDTAVTFYRKPPQ